MTRTGTQPTHYISLHGGTTKPIDDEIVDEVLACISVNGRELATFMCSPNELDKLALGFLYNEGIIESMKDVASLHLSKSDCVEIFLNKEFTPPERLIVTAGCGGGVTFDDFSKRHDPLILDTRIAPEELSALMKQVHLGAELYQRSGGIHTAALADADQILIQVEDLGRHNCVDKIAGAALQRNISTRGKILLTSGRISSEMINKARRLETPIVCSRTSPTSLSVRLAQAWNVTLVAYMVQDRMRIYSHPERVL
jgi:FdhD protein